MGKHLPLDQRILANILEDANGCWIWQMHIAPDGYGRMSVKSSPKAAHRIAFEVFRGPIPSGMEVDHRCFQRSCVNGHEFTPENTYIRPTSADGQRDCRACIRERVRRYQERRRAA